MLELRMFIMCIFLFYFYKSFKLVGAQDFNFFKNSEDIGVDIEFGINDTLNQGFDHKIRITSSVGIHKIRERSRTFSYELKKTLLAKNEPIQSNNTEAGFIMQQLDHFNESDSRRWKQYFYFNTDSTKHPSVNFLHVGGESAISKSDVLDGVWMMMVWAKLFGASAYSLEHRFYGNSLPLGSDFSTENLRYLTSQQVLADTSLFIRTINLKRNISNPKWILFGGSYAGNIAAWFRLRYPELAVGAVASSAPLQAIANFKEYYQTVQVSLKNYAPSSCPDTISKYFLKAKRMIRTNVGRAKLGICPLALSETWHPIKDTHRFYDAQLSELGSVVQEDAITHANLTNICSMYDKMVQLNNGSVDEEQCINSSYRGYIELLKDTTPTWYRAWQWQKCTEFGFFQTAYPGNNTLFKGAFLPAKYDYQLCTDVFGPAINASTIDDAVNKTNDLYGGADKYNGTNVVFINGSEDPWHSSGVLKSNTSSVIAILIPGTSHCRDMFVTSSTDPHELTTAHNTVQMEFAKWINALPTS